MKIRINAKEVTSYHYDVEVPVKFGENVSRSAVKNLVHTWIQNNYDNFDFELDENSHHFEWTSWEEVANDTV